MNKGKKFIEGIKYYMFHDNTGYCDDERCVRKTDKTVTFKIGNELKRFRIMYDSDGNQFIYRKDIGITAFANQICNDYDIYHSGLKREYKKAYLINLFLSLVQEVQEEETKEDLVYYLSLINKLGNITTVREYISIKANILDFIEEYGCWKDCKDSTETLNLIHYITPQMVLYWDENGTVQKYKLTDECMRIYKIYTLVLKELLENQFKYEVMYHQDRFYSNDKEKLITGVSGILGIYEEYIEELVEEL